MTPADQIRELTSLIEGTSITLLELTTPDGALRLRRDGGAAPVREAETITIHAPSAGIFRTAHPTQDNPLAPPGARVTAGQALALLQIGTLLLHVPAPAGGVVLDLLAAEGDLVGYGAPLMRLTETTP